MASRLSMLAVAVLGTAWLMISFVGKEAAGRGASRPASLKGAPTASLKAIGESDVCATHGAAQWGGGGMHVTEPTFRAVALGSRGDAARIKFTYNGGSQEERRLASSQLRRQVGVKLRAMNGCNLVYVMWRIEPKPGLEVQVKYNPGCRNNDECGTRGYTKIRARRSTPLPLLTPGASQTLQAEIIGNELRAWVDDQMIWRGDLGPEAATLAGPAGVRTDNVDVDISDFSAPGDPAARVAPPKCDKNAGDD